VFCDEQGVSLAAELDGRDDEALHLVVVEDGAVIATCRLLLDGDKVKLARMPSRRMPAAAAWPRAARPGRGAGARAGVRRIAPTRS
jgi:predicted GNAT family N-acyltransferase